MSKYHTEKKFITEVYVKADPVFRVVNIYFVLHIMPAEVMGVINSNSYCTVLKGRSFHQVVCVPQIYW